MALGCWVAELLSFWMWRSRGCQATKQPCNCATPRRAASSKTPYQLLEVLAAMFEVSVLVEACAGGREEHDVAGLCVLACVSHRASHVARGNDRGSAVEC